MDIKLKVEVDGEWVVLTWAELNESILFGNDLTNNRKVLWTGLQDKNGKDIYEGDIIESKSNIITVSDNKPTGEIAIKKYRVGWHESGCFNLFKGLSDTHKGITGITISCLKYYSVIGNIYENPELLSSPLPPKAEPFKD